MKNTRTNIRAILANEYLRKKLMVPVIQATQAREGIITTKKQAEEAYDKIRAATKFRYNP